MKVAELCPTLCDPMNYTVHGILQAGILKWVAFPFSGGSSQPRDWTQISHIAGGFFAGWATGKPKNTEVGSLSLHVILPTQELNRGLLCCRWILYQLSYQASPDISPNLIYIYNLLCLYKIFYVSYMYIYIRKIVFNFYGVLEEIYHYFYFTDEDSED